MHLFLIFIFSGIIFIALGEFLYLDYTGLGKRKALKEFPAAAKEFGFELTKKRSSQSFGFFTGHYDGYDFNITPDYSAKITLKMKTIKGLNEISTAPGNIDFVCQNPLFNKMFKTRQSTEDVIPVIQQATRFHKGAIAFAQQWRRPSDYIGINDSEIRVTLRYGHGSHIPASVLRQIIPDMITLADTIQQDLGNN